MVMVPKRMGIYGEGADSLAGSPRRAGLKLPHAGFTTSSARAMTTEARALTKERSDPTGPNWPGWVALVWVLGSLLGPLAVAGIWDPHELTVAELSRRIALHLYGAEA